MIYLDSCALVKLVRDEDESEALHAWLAARGTETTVTSLLAQTEVPRVIRRNNHNDQGALIDAAELTRELEKAQAVLRSVRQLAVDRDILERAGAIESPMLRSLDAIHLVSALQLARVGPAVVTYDRRFAVLARETGLNVVSPGAAMIGDIGT